MDSMIDMGSKVTSATADTVAQTGSELLPASESS